MKKLFTPALLALVCASAMAQTAAPQADAADPAPAAQASPQPAPKVKREMVWSTRAGDGHTEFKLDDDDRLAGHLAGPLAERMAFIGTELGNERTVKGAPYCADAVHETVQILADGNRIVKKQNSRNCRDGEGRTRQELDRDGRKTVFVRDPVAHRNFSTGEDGRIITINIHGPEGAEAAKAYGERAREYAERAREYAEKMTREMRIEMRRGEAGAPPVPPKGAVPPVPPQPVVITEDLRDDGNGNVVRDRRVMRVEARPGMPPLPAMHVPQIVLERAMSFAPRGPGDVSSLGSKEIAGLKVNGERTTWTIEAGKIGNEKPIVITRDVWTSPELMVTVASRDFDPRSGEVNYRLENVKRAEPDAALFKAPPDAERPRTPRPPRAASGAKN
ncbi:MAG TPA: hypothetical protein VGE47_14865 [Burkholderiaceae bacterium]